MKHRQVILTALSAVILLAGCQTIPTESQVYFNSFDDTWDAALRTVIKLSGREPAHADKDKGKIVSEVYYGDITETAGSTDSNGNISAFSTRKEVEAWVSTVTVAPTGGGTKVSVTIRRGSFTTSQPFDGSLKSRASGGVVLGTTDSSPLNKFLYELRMELQSDREN